MALLEEPTPFLLIFFVLNKVEILQVFQRLRHIRLSPSFTRIIPLLPSFGGDLGGILPFLYFLPPLD